MPKYIDADELIWAVDGNRFVTDSVKSYVRCTVRNIPAADVEGKRMEGIWIEQPESLNDRRDKIYRCSICGYADEQSPSAEVPYCWHCGSKMKREVK